MFEDVINQMRNSQMSNNPLADIMDNAALVAKAMVGAQKQQRSEPFMNALRKLGEEYGSADAKSRPTINQQANKVRADYIASGGSPIDIDQSMWGGDPSKGFQTGTGQFTPGYFGDNLSIGQKLAQAPITGMFERKLTFPALVSNQQLANERKQLEQSALNSARDYEISSGNLAETTRYHDILSGQQDLDNLFKIWASTGTAPEGIPGVKAGTSLYDKVAERQNNMQTAIKLAQEDVRYMDAQTAEERQQVINEYFNMLTGQSGGGITDEDILSMTKK